MANKYPKINYIGNKIKILDWISTFIDSDTNSIADVFSGGGSVSFHFKSMNLEVHSNDKLYSNYVISKALIENDEEKLDIDKLKELHKKISSEDFKVDENLSELLAEKFYFQHEVQELNLLLKISSKLNSYEKYLFLALVRRSMIRKMPYSRFNVPWKNIVELRDEELSYQKYKRRRAYHNDSFFSHILMDLDNYNDSIFSSKKRCKTYNLDAYEFIDQLEYVDCIYIDPPYPGTMNDYAKFYGIIDQTFGMKAPVFETDFTKKREFITNFELLLRKASYKSKYALISLNTLVKPSLEEIILCCEKFGVVNVLKKNHIYKVTGIKNKNKNEEVIIKLEFNNREVKNAKI
jgi:adenine-specific DNA-methyltransferase